MGSVLIVDDERGVRELVRRWLDPLGYEIREAADAHSAVAAIEKAPPSVVICDIHMPGGPNGLWLSDRVRVLSPATAVVLATADATVPPAESLRKGIVAYVLKPFRREQLLIAVADGLQWAAEEAARIPPRREQRRLGD